MLYVDKIQSFHKWSVLKINIHCTLTTSRYFKSRDIWWASLGVNIGSEEDGKNNNFERPVLVLKKFNEHLALIAPLSSKLKENNQYYHKILIISYNNSVMISQIRIMSVKRLIRKMGRLDPVQFKEVIEKLMNFW